MRCETAFVGDIHGNLAALAGLVEALGEHGAPHMVFLGDYINKGVDSAAVLQQVITYAAEGRATLLRGNHELALVDALESGNLMSFLKMGGAMTIRSYTGQNVGPDVLAEFSACFPNEHLQAIREMRDSYESDDVVARHGAFTLETSKFRISAHVPVGGVPRIGPLSAEIDTGCGVKDGRLTAVLWPSCEFVQVDGSGDLVVSK